MFTEDELALLPTDPDAALLKANELAQSKTFTVVHQLWLTNADGEDYFDTSTAADYLVMMHAISSALGYHDLARHCDVALRSERNPAGAFNDAYDKIKRALLKTVVMRGLAKRTEQKSIGFSPDTRASLHSYIAIMRNEIHKIELPIEKKEIILRRLNDLAKEIDTDRTRLQSLTDLALDLTDTVDEVHKKLSPVRRVLERLFRKFGEAREEQTTLEAPEKPMQIEGPKEAEPSSRDLDDEIPF